LGCFVNLKTANLAYDLGIGRQNSMSAFYKLGLWVGQKLRKKLTSRNAPPVPSGTIVENRPLSEDERTLLVWLIEHGIPEAHEFTGQMEEARVVGRCACGCPSIDLGIRGAKRRTVGPSQILADFMGKTPEGLEVVVLLHARGGKLSELEIYNFPEHEGAFSLPTLGSLKPTY
jgi:hypothetical protein